MIFHIFALHSKVNLELVKSTFVRNSSWIKNYNKFYSDFYIERVKSRAVFCGVENLTTCILTSLDINNLESAEGYR